MSSDRNFNPAYSNKTCKVRDLLGMMQADDPKTARIPSIQRPFVWEPHQVARLQDEGLYLQLQVEGDTPPAMGV